MPEMGEPVRTQDPEAVFREQNFNQAMFYIRQLKVHCVLFVEGPLTDPARKALIYREMLGIAKLYEPERASI